MTPEQCWNNLKRIYGESVYEVVERILRKYGIDYDHSVRRPADTDTDTDTVGICINNVYPNECEHPFCPEHTAPRFDSWEGEGETYVDKK